MAGDCATRISDTRRGDRTIILLHGYLESLDVWDDFSTLLAPHMRVVSIDLPGHGVSQVKGTVHTMEFLADTVRAAMQTLEIDKAVIAGHSMGGYVALELMRKYPEAAAGLILIHSTPNSDSDKKKADREREIEIIEGGKKELIAKSFPHVGFAPQNRKRLEWAIEELSEQIVMTEDEGIVAILRGISDRSDLNEAMRESTVPQLLIFGRHDEYVTPETAEATIAAHPQAEVLWLENSGHMGFIEEPEKTAEAVTCFVGRIFGETQPEKNGAANKAPHDNDKTD